MRTRRPVRLVLVVVLFWLLPPPGTHAEPRASAPAFDLREVEDGFVVVGWDVARLRTARDRGKRFTVRRFPLRADLAVDLELEPFRVTGPETRFVLGRRDGPDVPFAFDASSVLLFRGTVAGRTGSHVFLALAPSGSTGTIDLGSGGARFGLSGGRRGADRAEGRLSVFEATGPVGLPPGVPACHLEKPEPSVTVSDSPVAAKELAALSVEGPRIIELAVDTDNEFYRLFDDGTDAATYLIQMYGAVSDIYLRDLETLVVLGFTRLWPDADDLFSTLSSVSEFRDYWEANLGFVHRDVAQLVSGRRDFPYGGQAFLSGLCGSAGYSVIGYVLGHFPDPDAPSPYNYDVQVASHELGHVCGAWHTHDVMIDTCADPMTVPQRGTIMSYCSQTWSGQNALSDNYFHTRTRQDMLADISSAACLDRNDCNVNGVPDGKDIRSGTSADVNGNGIPDECEDCNDNSVFDDQDIATGTSTDLDGDSVPDECQPDCNGNGVPDGLDIANGTSLDRYGNAVPDECEVDCDADGVSDYTEIQLDITLDRDRDAVLDACEDCDGDGMTDLVELGGANRAWVASGLVAKPIREFHPTVGVVTRVSDGALPALVNQGQDLIVTPDSRILVSSANDHRVLEFDSQGAYVTDLVPSGSGGLIAPAGLLYLPAGTLLVASSGTDSVLAYDGVDGTFQGAFVAPGAGGLTGPFGLARGPEGHLFVTSATDEVLEYDGETGAFLRRLVDAGNNGGLDQPRGLVFKRDGNLLVASFGSNEVLEFDGPTGDPIGRWALSGNGTVLTQVSPWGIRIGPDGNVFVSRTGEAFGSGGSSDQDHDHETSSTGDLHITNAQIYEFDVRNGNFLRTYVGGNDHGLHFATGFDFVPGQDVDCNVNATQDVCDLASGTSQDLDLDGVPDECEADCDADGVPDSRELIPFGPELDCNFNDVPDRCDLAAHTSRDCDSDAVPDECDVSDALETGQGWTVGGPFDTASSGVWEHVDPVGNGAQPENDHTPTGTHCFVTGQGDADVDGGRTTLRSPLFDLHGDFAAEIGYWRWFSNDTGANPGQDVLTVDVSGDGGASWVNVEVVGPSSPQTRGGWLFHSFRVADLVDPTGGVMLRFIAEDSAGDSTVEAAIDDVTIVAACCASNLDCNDNLACTTEACDPEFGICSVAITAGSCAIGGTCYADGATNPLDGCQVCDASVPDAWSSEEPVEVASVTVQRTPDTLLSWADQGASQFDVVGGAVADLVLSGGVTNAACLASDRSETTWADVRPDPVAGAGYYYLIRSRNACGDGGFGHATSGEDRIPAAACP